MSCWLRRATACLGTLGVLGLALLPTEHVHLAADHDDHLRAEVVHRHFEPHHGPRLATHVENPENDPTYLSSAFTIPDHSSPAGPQGSISIGSEPEPAAPGSAQWRRKARDLRVHDPPWACAQSLRGPPSLLA